MKYSQIIQEADKLKLIPAAALFNGRHIVGQKARLITKQGVIVKRFTCVESGLPNESRWRKR